MFYSYSGWYGSKVQIFLQLNYAAQCLLLAVGQFDSCQGDFYSAQDALSDDWSAFLGYISAPPSLWDGRAPFNLMNSWVL